MSQLDPKNPITAYQIFPTKLNNKEKSLKIFNIKVIKVEMKQSHEEIYKDKNKEWKNEYSIFKIIQII